VTYIGQILLERPTSDEHIAEAVAGAFGVGHVTVWPMAQVFDLNADLIVQRDDQPGEFPALMRLAAMPGSGIGDKLSETEFIDRSRAIAAKLGQFLLTDDAGIDPFDYEHFLLIAPGGETVVVEAEEQALNENRIELTPESRAHRATLAGSAAAITP
jgi:hypothetical protein